MWALTMGLMSCDGKENELSGQEVYEIYCGICHGNQGEGYIAPAANALSNPEFLSAATDSFIRESTIYGRPGTKMSPWGEPAGGPLTLEEVDKVVEYIRLWDTLPPADIHDMEIDGDPAAGAEVYAASCAGCHGGDGEGASALSLNHPEFLRVASDGYIWHAIAVGRSGTGMASYADFLSEEDMFDLVALIRSWEEE